VVRCVKCSQILCMMSIRKEPCRFVICFPDFFFVIYLTTLLEAVAWFVETLCYKPEGRGFDSR
jgi:hypothetical protein